MSPSRSVSVVIAHHGLGGHLLECLRAHLAELEEDDECVAVIAGAPSDDLGEEFAAVTLVHQPADCLTPELWSAGLRLVHAEFVRVTIGSFLPEQGWRAAMISAHGKGAAGVSGPIRPATGLRGQDLAIFFQRYRQYGSAPPGDSRVHDIPADHASYSSACLKTSRPLWEQGFWELEVNAFLVQSGAHLARDPGFIAHYLGGESAGSFMRQRFRHGLRHGSERMVHRSFLYRAAFVATLFLPGTVFGLKIVRDVWAGGDYLKLLRALPWLPLFVGAWAIGEWQGACRALLTRRD
ncbi:MAG: hypothetical protein QGI93_06350 [Planctomycetota bacterium]|nr:hypothetical protein [Planctomycetota bacterium]MDP6938546.1 hypothetical protein [Planctomycetota bacterium]